MTSVVGVYLLSGSACLVHMWVSVCVQACLVGWGMELRGNVITGLCPKCSHRPRWEEGKICIKNTFFEIWADLNKPTVVCPREKNYYLWTHVEPWKNGHPDKSQCKRWKGEKWCLPVSSAFWILCNHQDFAHSQFCCLPWQITFLCCCWGLWMPYQSRGNPLGKCEFQKKVRGKGAQKQGWDWGSLSINVISEPWAK